MAGDDLGQALRAFVLAELEAVLGRADMGAKGDDLTQHFFIARAEACCRPGAVFHFCDEPLDGVLRFALDELDLDLEAQHRIIQRRRQVGLRQQGRRYIGWGAGEEEQYERGSEGILSEGSGEPEERGGGRKWG